MGRSKLHYLNSNKLIRVRNVIEPGAVSFFIFVAFTALAIAYFGLQMRCNDDG